MTAQEAGREPDLVPVRRGRMLVSPFTFYRGAAAIMAQDLRDTPRSGLPAQLCGDAHLLNFGVFGSPGRRLVFDLNDYDETLPGPFEYDVKRMAASFVVAARDNGFTPEQAQSAAVASVTAYRTAMRDFAQRRTMDVWYASLDEAAITASVTAFASAQADTARQAKGEGAHARSGDPVAIAAYLGQGDAFDRSIVDFAVRYADQNERDYAEFSAAVRSGRLAAVTGVQGRGILAAWGMRSPGSARCATTTMSFSACRRPGSSPAGSIAATSP